MIDLKVDFTLLNKYFGIPAAKIPQYMNKDIEEVMKLEAAQGNQKAKDYQKILADPDKLLEIFKLSNVENRYAILQNMSEGDLDDLLPYLTPQQLSKGLNFFTEDKLMEMAYALPTEILTNMVLEKFNLYDVMAFMDDDGMNEFLAQPDVERKYAQKYFESLNAEVLQKIMVSVYGKDFEEKSQKENLEYIENLRDGDYHRFLYALEREDKMNLINGIAQQNTDLVYLFKNEDMVQPMGLLMKEDKIKMMSTLDPEFMIPMIKELPLDLTQIVLTQIDPRDFSEILTENFQDVLSEVVLFSAKSF